MAWMLNRPKSVPTLDANSPKMQRVKDCDISSVKIGTNRLSASPHDTQLCTTTGGLVDLPADPFLYKDLVRLGEGNHGTVFKGVCHGTPVAVKFMKPTVHESQLFEREAEIASSVFHPRCVLLLGAFKLRESVVLVTEYVEGGSLADLLFKSNRPLTLSQKLEIAIEIAEGMAWLSGGETTIIHKDLKPHNILLTKEYHCKIADFGLSCLQEKKSQFQVGSTSGAGTLAYMAPEVLTYYKNSDNDIVTSKSDVYSFGVMIFEILCQKKFTEIQDWEELETYILEGKRPSFPSEISDKLQNLVSRCWSCCPKERPTFVQIDEILKQELKCCDKKEISLILSNQEDASEFWLKYVDTEKHIKFPDFVRHLLSTLPKNTDMLPSDLSHFLAQILFPNTRRNILHNEMIKLSHLGNLLSWFGEFEELLINLEFLWRQDWFHGSISRSEADLALGGCPSGTFLLRLNTGSNPDSPIDLYPHTISFVNGGKVYHVRLSAGNPYFNIKLPLGDERPPIIVSQEPIFVIMEELKRHGICCFAKKRDKSSSPYIE